MPAIWAPHGVGPRDEDLFVGNTHDTVNRNAFDPSVLRERGPWNSTPCVVIDGEVVRIGDSPTHPLPPQAASGSSTSGSFGRRLTPRARRRQAEVAELQSSLNDIRRRFERVG